MHKPLKKPNNLCRVSIVSGERSNCTSNFSLEILFLIPPGPTQNRPSLASSAVCLFSWGLCMTLFSSSKSGNNGVIKPRKATGSESLSFVRDASDSCLGLSFTWRRTLTNRSQASRRFSKLCAAGCEC